MDLRKHTGFTSATFPDCVSGRTNTIKPHYKLKAKKHEFSSVPLTERVPYSLAEVLFKCYYFLSPEGSTRSTTVSSG